MPTTPRPTASTAAPARRVTTGTTVPRRRTVSTAPGPSRSPAVDAYIARAAPFAQPILKHLRAVLHRACPRVTETIKWGMPAFDHHGLLASMAAFKSHCTFGFFKGALLEDPTGVLQERGRTAMGHFGRITALADLPSDASLSRLVRTAMKLNEKGVKVPRRTRAAAPIVVPADFKKALHSAPKARAAFDAFPPSHRGAYIEWIVEAKRSQTRARRISTAIEWLEQGKGRNWKYERSR